jgi:hypothetical protein
MRSEASAGWRLSRYLTLAAVLALHAVLLAALLVTSRYKILLAPPNQPIELLYLPASPPRETRPAQPLTFSPETLLPSLPSNALTIVAPLPAFPMNDAGRRDVDWGEEQRRAAEAFANTSAAPIMGDKPNPPSSASSSSLPDPRHHAGEQFKLDTGDWIVWINDYCYQISEWAPRAGGSLGVLLPDTICPGESATRSDLFQDLPEYKKHHSNE